MTVPSGTIDYEEVGAAPHPRNAPEDCLSRIMKDCFGTVISSLKKMKECIRCELLRECRAINWTSEAGEAPPTITRRPADPSGGDAAAGTPRS